MSERRPDDLDPTDTAPRNDATQALTGEAWERIHEVVRQVLDAPVSEQPARLDALCRDEPELHEQVRRVIGGATTASWDGPTVGVGLGAGHLPRPGDRLGPYRVVRELGRGGMGVVYLAERVDVEKRVALKVVTSWASRERIDRLLAEQRILARLEHPNIAQWVDAGRTGSGVPFFAMEYVDGEPIDIALARDGASLDERVRVLAEVCRAVHFLHQSAVVHRDLKPSNILLNRTGDPKLLDFGIAKLVDDSDDAVGLTRTGMRMLTPAWASPEQVLSRPITTASDIYSLGVLAYHLLTGASPYPEARTAADTEDAVVRVEPPAPSRRQRTESTAGDSTPLEGGERLGPDTPRAADLDAICLQAMRKAPEDRYASAAQMAADFEAYRRGLPVEARGDHTGYRVRRFLARHRAPVSAVAMMVLLLVAWATSAVVQSARLEEERDRARLEASKAQTVSDFLVDLFEVSDPEISRGAEPTARELLERGTARIDELSSEPELQAELMGVMAGVYRQLGWFDRAETLFLGALGATQGLDGDHRIEQARLLDQLGEVDFHRGNFDQGLERLREAAALHAEVSGDEAEETLLARETLAHVKVILRRPAEAVEPLREMIAMREAEDRPSTALATNYRFLGDALTQLGDTEAGLDAMVAAWKVFEQRDALGPAELKRRAPEGGKFELTAEEELEVRVQTLTHLGSLATSLERYELAEEVLESGRVLLLAENADRPHPVLSQLLGSLGDLAARRGDVETAQEHLRANLELIETTWGKGHPKMGMALLKLAHFAAEQNDPAAEALFHEAIEVLSARTEGDHPHLAAIRFRLAQFYFDQGRPTDALEIARQVLGARLEAYGPSHRNTAQAELLVGASLSRLDQHAEARPHVDRGIATLEALEAEDLLPAAYEVRSELLATWPGGAPAESDEPQVGASIR